MSVTDASHAYLRAMGIDYFVTRSHSEEIEAAVELSAAEVAPRPSTPEPEPQVLIDSPGSAPVARAQVVAADNWVELTDQVVNCRACGACESRTQALFGQGALDSKWLFVTDSPGSAQDQSGEVFSGPGGLLLKEMLQALGLNASNAYCTQVLKCRTPGGRDPEAQELNQCSAYLKAQIKLINPAVIVALGRVAAQTLTGSSAPLARLRGQLHKNDEFRAPVVASYRPEYLLQSPAKKASTWQDLKLAMQVLGGRA